jgi:hypothetical protein
MEVVEETVPAVIYNERKTVEEAEYESKLLTQKSLFELGRTTAKEAIAKESREEVEEFFEEAMQEYALEEATMELVYSTPTLLMDMLLEKHCDQIASLQGIKSKVVKRDTLKMLIYIEMQKKRVEGLEEELKEMEEDKEEFEGQVSDLIDEVEALEEKNREIELLRESLVKKPETVSWFSVIPFYCLFFQMLVLVFLWDDRMIW